MERMLTVIGNEFNKGNLWYKYEQELINNVIDNINRAYPDTRNLLIKSTWFSPKHGSDFKRTLQYNGLIDNVFYLAGVDPIPINDEQLALLIANLGHPKLFLLGNFDNSQYSFSTFGYWPCDTLSKINVQPLTTIKYKFINYNRKPATHKCELYNLINNIDKSIVTLGQYNGNKIVSNRNEIVKEDSLSFGPLDVWNHHFLNVVSETTFNWWDNIFVSEKTFKPIIGLRPFIINGNWRTYLWLRRNGFKTFNHYFPFAQLENLHEDDVIPNIVKVIKWVSEQDNKTLLNMYNNMLPDLLHNRERAKKFALEQKIKMENILL